MANTYDVGKTVRLTGTFSVNAVNTDPTTVTLKLKKPGVATPLSYTFAAGEIIKSGTGVYYKDITIDRSGKHYYRFEGTGAVATADENYFDVSESEFYA